MTTTSTPAKRRAAGWLAGAVAIMPLLQVLPIDFDRSGVLILLLPALWAGRGELNAAVGDLFARRWAGALVLLGSVSVVASVATADQPAPAAVTAASWFLLGAAALIAGRSTSDDAAARTRLLGGLALGSAIGAVAMWAWWLAQSRGAMPLYAHHRHLGLHALSGAVASVALIVGPERSRARRAFAWSAGIVTWGALLWSGGRGPVLALGVALVAWICLRPSNERRALIRAATLLACGGLVLSAAFWSNRSELGWWHAFERTASAARAGDVSELTSTRSEGWRESWHRAAVRPWLGHGPDAYRFLTPKLDGQQPHNVVLQAWLDLGWIGGSALLLLLATTLGLGVRHARDPITDAAGAGWFAVLCALTVAGLLDGVFYHLLAFLPAMLAAGVVLLSRLPPRTSHARWPFLASAVTLATVVVLIIHTTLFHALAVAEPPRPDGAMPRLLRAFPSTTYGLWRWTDAWEAGNPDVALAWDRWAQTHAANAPLFHLRAAQRLINRGDRNGAIMELRAAEAKAHWTVRPSIVRMREQIEAGPH